MVEASAQIWLLILLGLAIGTPLAVLIDRRRSGTWLLLFEGVTLGVIVVGVVGLSFARWLAFAPGPILGFFLALAAAGWIVIYRARLVPPLPSMSPTVAFGAALVLLATLLRARPVHFVYQVGDFGEYVARADQLADAGAYPEGFLPLFTVLISTTQLVVGPDDLTVAASVFGVLLVLAVSAVLIRLGTNAVAVGLVAVLLAVGAVPSWFGSFPATETLYAFLVAAFLYFIAKAVGPSGSALDVVPVAASALALSLTRGNALLLALLLIVGVVVLALRVDPARYRLLVWSVVASLGAVWLGALFAVRYHNNYFVETQLANLAPAATLPTIRSLEEARWAVAATLVVLAVLATLAWGLVWFSRRFAVRASSTQSFRRRLFSLWGVGLGLFMLVCVLAVARLGHEGLREGVEGFGLLFICLATLGVVATLIGARRDDLLVVGSLAILLLGAYSVFYASRFPAPIDHSFYRYWHRYLFSEVFPVAAILAGIGAAALYERGRQIVRFPDLPIAGGVAVLLVGGGILATIDDGNLARQHVLFEDDFEQIEQIAELLPEDTPILYDGLGGFPGFPNTFRAFGEPLRTSFDREVLNRPAGYFDADRRVTAEQLAAATEEHGRVVLLSVGPPGAAASDLPDVVGGAFGEAQSVDVSVRTLRQTRPTRWEKAPLRAEIRSFQFGPPSSRFIGFGTGIGKREPEGAGGARWTQAQGSQFTIEVGPSGRMSLRLRLRSFLVARSVRLVVDGKTVGRGQVSATRTTPILAQAKLAPGRHTVKIISDPPPRSISEALGTADERSVALRIVEPVVVR